MDMTLEEYLASEWKFFRAGFEIANEQEEYELYDSWAPHAVAAYENILENERKEKFLTDADIRVNQLETDVVDTQEAIAELGVLADDNSVSVEDLMEAIAELGALVASLGE